VIATILYLFLVEVPTFLPPAAGLPEPPVGSFQSRAHLLLSHAFRV
jgi:hypothetical protein